MENTNSIMDIFGTNVFNDKAMRQYLPKSVYYELKKTIEGRKELDPVEVLEIGKVIDDFFVVTEYADNTIRGTERTKHWRVGGS